MIEETITILFKSCLKKKKIGLRVKKEGAFQFFLLLHGCNLTWKSGKTLKNLEFDNLDKKNLEIPGIREILKMILKCQKF